MPAETYTKTTTTYTAATDSGRNPGPRLLVVRETGSEPRITLSVPPKKGTRGTWEALEIPDFEALRQLVEAATEALLREEKTDV